MDRFELLRKAPQVGAFFVSVVWEVPAQAFRPARSERSSARVEWLLGGDTRHLVDGRRVRLSMKCRGAAAYRGARLSDGDGATWRWPAVCRKPSVVRGAAPALSRLPG